MWFLVLLINQKDYEHFSLSMVMAGRVREAWGGGIQARKTNPPTADKSREAYLDARCAMLDARC